MSRYVNPFPQHFTAEGPAAFYNVFFGIANQDPKTNPKVPFSDAGFQNDLTAKQTLDANGAYAQDIFLNGLYSIRIETPLGSLFRESPSISGLSALTTQFFNTVTDMVAATNLAVGGTAITLGYTTIGDGGDNTYEIVAAGTGTADGGSFINLATHQAKGLFPGGVINVKQFGALGITGDTTDDSPQFINWVAYLVSLTGGATGHIPDGEFVLDFTVQVAADDIVIKGNGAATRIQNGQADAPAILIGDGITRYFRNEVSNIVFEGKTGVTGVSGQYGLATDKLGHSLFKNLYSFNFPIALFSGFNFEGVSQAVLTEISVQGSLGTGVEILNCVDLYVSSSRSDNNTSRGFSIKDSEGMYFSGVTAFGNNIAWDFPVGVVGNNKNMFFVNCVGDSSESFNWLISELNTSFFTNCWGATQQDTGVNAFAAGFFLSTAAVFNIGFDNCRSINNNSHGFNVSDGCARINFVNCTAEANGQSGAGSGLNLSTSSDCGFSNGYLTSNASNGIIVSSAAVRPIITENHFITNTGAAVSNSSTTAVIRNNLGHITENNGLATIPSGSTSVVVSHGLDTTPADGDITTIMRENPTNDPGNIYITSVTSTQFTINSRNDPGASNLDFGWSVIVL